MGAGHEKKPNSEMTNEDIQQVIQWSGEQAQDTVWVDEKPVFGRIGLGMMSIWMQSEFPDWGKQYNLSQFIKEGTDDADYREEFPA